ncbi:MAG: DNA-methyltransferase [Candidatus Asgardarchaeia archaeon]
MKLEIIQGDCLKLLPKIESNKIDLIVTDPPYFVLKYQEWDKFRSIEDYLDFTEKWMKECERVLKGGGSMYIFWSQMWIKEFYLLLDSFSKLQIKRMLIWHHPNLAKTTNRMYLWTYDPVFFIVKGDKPKKFHAKFAKKTNVDVFNIPKPQRWKGKERYHPTEKPIKLVKIFVENSSDPGDWVLDPFLGSGTTAVVCKMLNRNFIGFEVNPDYIRIAEERINELLKQSTLEKFVKV